MLPFNLAGIGLIALGIGGLLAFMIGAVILIDTDVPGYGVPLPLIFGLAIVSALFVLTVVRFAFKARRRKVVSGREELVGSRGEVMTDFAQQGWARVHGETWQVKSAAPLAKGQSVRVTGIDGLVLEVEPDAMPSTGGTS
jgi:membrane-bound serine protease (ClpP class)